MAEWKKRPGQHTYELVVPEMPDRDVLEVLEDIKKSREAAETLLPEFGASDEDESKDGWKWPPR
jgi:hypothetical protein